MPDKLHRHFQWVGGGIYLTALLVVSLCFRTAALKALWWAWGLCTVLFFFVMSYWYYRQWRNDDSKLFLRKVFLWALGIRLVYVAFCMFYYYYQTGMSMEYGAADSLGYHDMACYLSNLARHGQFRELFGTLNSNTMGFSDQGYIIYLTALYTCFGNNILGPRILKTLMSAYLCVVIYKLASRNLGERTARIAAVMSAFLPQFIHYTGTYMKETEMVFLATLAMERMDYLIHSRKYCLWNILIPFVLTALTFGFRTIVGMALIASFLVYVLCCDKTLISKRTRIITIITTVILSLVLLFSPIGWEMYLIFRINIGTGDANLEKYLFPGFLTLPLTNLVEVANANQKMMNGTFFVKNYLAFFALWSIVLAFREKQWRKLSLVGSYTILYALMIAFSFAFNSERYHLPVMPGLLIMAAFAMSHFRKRDFKYYYAYCALLLVAIVVWNYVKVAGIGSI